MKLSRIPVCADRRVGRANRGSDVEGVPVGCCMSLPCLFSSSHRECDCCLPPGLEVGSSKLDNKNILSPASHRSISPNISFYSFTFSVSCFRFVATLFLPPVGWQPCESGLCLGLLLRSIHSLIYPAIDLTPFSTI